MMRADRWLVHATSTTLPLTEREESWWDLIAVLAAVVGLGDLVVWVLVDQTEPVVLVALALAVVFLAATLVRLVVPERLARTWIWVAFVPFLLVDLVAHAMLVLRDFEYRLSPLLAVVVVLFAAQLPIALVGAVGRHITTVRIAMSIRAALQLASLRTFFSIGDVALIERASLATQAAVSAVLLLAVMAAPLTSGRNRVQPLHRWIARHWRGICAAASVVAVLASLAVWRRSWRLFSPDELSGLEVNGRWALLASLVVLAATAWGSDDLAERAGLVGMGCGCAITCAAALDIIGLDNGVRATGAPKLCVLAGLVIVLSAYLGTRYSSGDGSAVQRRADALMLLLAGAMVGASTVGVRATGLDDLLRLLSLALGMLGVGMLGRPDFGVDVWRRLSALALLLSVFVVSVAVVAGPEDLLLRSSRPGYVMAIWVASVAFVVAANGLRSRPPSESAGSPTVRGAAVAPRSEIIR